MRVLPVGTSGRLDNAREVCCCQSNAALVTEGCTSYSKAHLQAHTLVQQLNAIRNAKAAVRHESKARSRAALAKRASEEEAWKAQLNKERRKRRYQQETAEQKRNAKKART